MASFGWIAGIHYSPHISNADSAAFSCLLGMPWASSTDHYDPSAVPEIPQQDCASGFGEWLTPWLSRKVEWQLMTPDANGDWATIGTAREIVPAVSIGGRRSAITIEGPSSCRQAIRAMSASSAKAPSTAVSAADGGPAACSRRSSP